MKKHVLLSLRVLTVAALVFSLSTCGDFLKPGLGDEVDLEDPDVTIDSHSDGQYLSGQVTFEGSFADDIAGDTVKVSTNGGGSFSSATRIDKKNGVWSHDIDTTALADGEYEFRVRVTDGAGKSTDEKVLVYFDNTAPAILARTPQSLGTTSFNQTISVSGDAYDPFGVVQVDVGLFSVDAGGAQDSQLVLRETVGEKTTAESNGETPWDAAQGTSAWTYPLDTTLYAETVDGPTDFQLVFRATDRAGNTRQTVYHLDSLRAAVDADPTCDELPTIDGLYTATASATDVCGLAPTDLMESALDLTIDQEQDLPQFEFSIPSPSDPALGADPRATGSITDDDGVAPETIEILIVESVDGSDTLATAEADPAINWVPVTSYSGSGGRVSWEHDLSGLPQGDNAIALRAEDVNGRLAVSPGPADIRTANGLFDFAIDEGPPILSIDAPAAGSYHNANITLSGTAEDGTGINAVEVSTDGGSTWEAATVTQAPGETTIWDWEYTFTEPESATPPPDGTISFRVRAEDNALKTDTENVQVTLDLTAPVLEFLAPAANDEVNGSIIFQGTTEDFQVAELAFYDVAFGDVGSATPLATLTDSVNDFDTAPSSGNPSSFYRWYSSVDTTAYQTSGPASAETFTIVATDAAGNVGHTELPLSVDQASDIPTISIDTPSLLGGQLVYDTGSSLVVTIEDDDAVDTSTATYDLTRVSDGTPIEAGTALSFTTADDAISKRGTITLPPDGGEYTLDINVSDINGTADARPADTIQLDSGPPQLEVDAAFDGITYQGSAFTIHGTITDPLGLPANPVTVSVNGPAGAVDLSASPLVYDDAATPPTWSQDVPIGDGDGSYEISIEGTDQIGLSATETRVVQVDTTGPTLTVTAPVQNESTTSNLFTVTGSSRDTGGIGFDGTDDVEYSLDGGAWQPLTLSGTSWQGTDINIASSEGTHTFSFRSTDALGNQTVVGPITLFYDTAPPSFAEFAVGTTDTRSVNASLDFDGFAYDSNQLDSLSVSVDGGAQQPIPPSTVSPTLNAATDVFTATAHGLSDGDRILLGGDTLPELAGAGTLDPTAGYYVTGATADTFSLAETSGGGALDFTTEGVNLQTEAWSYTFDTTALSDGTYILVFTATDIAGKTATATRTVRLDTAGPESLSVDTDLTGWQDTQSISVSGTAADSGSGLSAVEYQLDGGAWNLVGGTASWTANIAFNKGNNSLVVRATDRAGNTAQTGSISVDVDVDAPALTVDSPTEIVKLNGGAALPVELSVSDLTSGTGVNSNIDEVLLKAGDTDFSASTTSAALDTGDTANGTWIADVPAADLLALAEGQRSIHVRATDAAGNQAFGNFAVLIDKTAPQVDFSALTNGTTVNKTLALSGTASDTQGLADPSPVTLEVYNQTTSSWEAGPAVSGSFSWTADLDTTAYDGAGSDYDTDAGTNGTQLDLRAVATDAAGNTATATRSVTIDQNADRPVIELSNIDVGAASTLKLSRTIYGSVQDDDGPVDSLEVSLDGSSWTAVTVSGGSWSYDIPGGESDGSKDLYFRVTDSAATPTTFETNGATSLDKPRILVDDTPTYMETAVTFNLDTVTPEIGPNIIVDRSEDGNYDFSGDEENLVTNLPFGGSKADFVLRVLASDANGIGDVSVEILGATGSPFTATANGTDGSYDVFDTGIIDLGSGIADGSVDVRVSVTDNSGLTSTATRTIIVDNTVPDISYLSPLETSIVNGDVEVRGTASDTGSGLTGVEYEIGYNADGTGWQPVSGSLFSWTIELTGSNRIDLYAGRAATVNETTDVITVADHGFSNDDEAYVNWSGDEPTGLDPTTTYYVTNATQDTFELSTSPGGAAVDITAAGTGVRVSNAGRDPDNDGIWDLPIVFRVTDEATNQRITANTDYVLQVDPTGDIPDASVVYPDPDSTQRTLGGSIRLSGTAVDDDGVAGVYMQIDVDGDGDYDINDTAGGTDWYNGGTGQLVDGTVSWNKTINESGEFNPTGGGPDPRPINFRVRARDVNGLDGPWTASQLIEVDDDVPQIGSSQPLTLEEQSTGASLPYVADRWLKGTWNLTGSIEDESGIADITIAGDVTGSLSANPSWFTEDVDGNYIFDIPVTTGASAGRLSFTITATDESTPQQQTSAAVSVQADNQAPTSNAYVGETPIVQSNLSYTLESSINEDGSGFGRVAFYFLRPDADGSAPGERVYAPMAEDVSTPTADLTQIDGLWFNEGTAASRPDEFTLVDAGLAGNENVRVGGLVRIDGLNRRIVSFDSGTGTLSWAEAVDTSVTDYAVAYAMVVDNETIETPVYSGDSLVSITNDDGDGMVESIERTGGLYEWTASIDSKNIPDGPVELHWVSFDEAGNFVTDSVTTSTANNRPLLAGITLGTDLDGSGTVEADEQEPAFSALDPEGNEQQVATVASDSFVAKTLTAADIDVVGGNGALQYDLSVGGTELRTLQPLRADELSAVQTIELSEGDLGADTSGTATKNLVFTIWDSTEESTPGTNSLSAELTAPILVDIVDEVRPKVVVSPFFWNNASDNSLYENNRENGHIEITGVVNGTDPDVSGQISIRGTAYDDQRLTSLWMAIDGFGFTGAGATSADFDTDADGVTETLATTYSRMATFSGGTWTGTDQWAGEGWKFTVTDSTLDQSGHEVSWRLDWDSSRVSGVAAIDTVIRALAVDKRSITAGANTNASSEIENAAPGDVTANNVPAYTVDVVPYIKGLVTRLSGANPSEPSAFDRSASGRYPVRAGETITIEGFNLPGTAANSVTINGVQKTPASGTTTAVDVNLGTDTSSGALSVTTNGVESPNNANSNGEGYHQEPNGVNNDLLTDDRLLYIWDFADLIGSVTLSSPVLRMDDQSNYYMSYGNNSNRLYLNNNGTVQQYDQTYNQFHNTMVGFDSSGNIYGVSSNTDRINDQTWGATSYTFYSRSPGTADSGNTAGFNNGTNKRRLELSYNGSTGVYDINRVEFPDFVVKGSGTDADPAEVYMAYYDGNSVDDQLKFRYGDIGTNDDDITGGIGNNLTNNDPGSAAGFQVMADASSTYPGGQYVGIDATSGGVAVAVWYDAQNRQLVYSYNDNPGGASAAQWQTNATVIDAGFAGWYADVTVDDSDGIHIAYYTSSAGDLKYAYLPAYNGSATVVTVDSYLSTGTRLMIETRDDGSGNEVPYITYFQPSFISTTNSVRVAWRTDFTSLQDGATSDFYTGSWEVMTVPTNNVPVDGPVSGAVPTAGTYGGSVFLSYYTDASYERAYLK